MKFSSRWLGSRAFTLLELLVVISIIAVLAGILLPVGAGVLDRAKRVDAKVTMTNAITAIKAYQTDYGLYPVVPVTDGLAKDTTFDTGESEPSSGKGGRNGYLFDVLRALNYNNAKAEIKALNSRRTVYFESKDVKNAADPRGGFIPSSTSGGISPKKGFAAGDLVDPWGNLYAFRIDSNYSDVIMQPYKITGDMINGVTYDKDISDDTTQSDNSKVLRVQAAGWCEGKDSMFGDSNGNLTTTCDDVVTWQ